MTNPDIFTVVSVDVIALTYDRDTRTVVYGTHRRDIEPFTGQQALPGVVVTSGERLATAAGRALSKLRLSVEPVSLGQLRTFDEPSRDPRGPSLSIAMWAVYPPETANDHETGVDWVNFDAETPLAFDHTEIIATVRPLLARMLWRDIDFTRTLTGDEFSAADAVAITGQLEEREPHRANLNRDLARIPGLSEAGTAPSGGGRPGKLWRWQ